MMTPEEEARWRHWHHENGADWLKKHVPNASKFGQKVAEILKISILGGLEPIKKRLLKNNWTDDSYIRVSVPADAMNGYSETNHLFILMHMCNQMNIGCHVSGMSFNNLEIRFSRKRLLGNNPIIGNTEFHLQMAEDYAKTFGGCAIEDFQEPPRPQVSSMIYIPEGVK